MDTRFIQIYNIRFFFKKESVPDELSRVLFQSLDYVNYGGIEETVSTCHQDTNKGKTVTQRQPTR